MISRSSRHTHMLPSTMLNLFRWALTTQCLEIILETVVISFLSVFHSSNHGLRETLGKIEYENLPVSATSQLFCHSSKCFATGSKSRATNYALHIILPKRACLASKSALSFFAVPTCASIHMKLTSRPLLVSCQHLCLYSCTNGWVCSEIFCDFIALIELIQSVKIKYLPSASFSIWFIAIRIAASSAVKTLAGPSSEILYCSLLNDGRQNQPLHPSVNQQCKINSMEKTMRYPSLMRAEQRSDTYRRGHRKAQLPYVCLLLECSKSLKAHVSCSQLQAEYPAHWPHGNV
jgi:hypothetical protein